MIAYIRCSLSCYWSISFFSWLRCLTVFQGILYANYRVDTLHEKTIYWDTLHKFLLNGVVSDIWITDARYMYARFSVPRLNVSQQVARASSLCIVQPVSSFDIVNDVNLGNVIARR